MEAKFYIWIVEQLSSPLFRNAIENHNRLLNVISGNIHVNTWTLRVSKKAKQPRETKLWISHGYSLARCTNNSQLSSAKIATLLKMVRLRKNMLLSLTDNQALQLHAKNSCRSTHGSLRQIVQWIGWMNEGVVFSEEKIVTRHRYSVETNCY